MWFLLLVTEPFTAKLLVTKNILTSELLCTFAPFQLHLKNESLSMYMYVCLYVRDFVCKWRGVYKSVSSCECGWVGRGENVLMLD